MAEETEEEGSINVPLKHPFKFGENQHFDSFTIPRPKAKHMRGINFKKIEEQEGDEILKFIQKLTGQPPSVIDRVDIEDVMALGEAISVFLPSGPTTGQTS